MGHAYILDGPDRSGKKMLAEAFAKTLQCENPEEAPCHQCRSCKQAETHNNPDIIYVTHEKPNVISVDEIRTQVVNDVDMKPYACRYKVYLIDEAEKMNPQAQNALLKTIEEPPSYAVILLLTNNSELFLQTILSRCIRLPLAAVPTDRIERFLEEKHGASEQEASLAAAFSQGNVGKAVSLCTSEEFPEIRASVTGLLKRIGGMDLSELMNAVRKINDYKNDINDYFDLLLIWFRDVLVWKSAGRTEMLTYRDEERELQKQAELCSYLALEEILQGIERARRRLSANVNFDLTMELLLLTIHDCFNRKGTNT